MSNLATATNVVPTEEKPSVPDKESWLPAQALREEQVANAVNFLSHPKVRGSPIVYRRSFLERKGLTKEEIDEAFRRVPDPPSDSTNTPVTMPDTQDRTPVAGAQIQPLGAGSPGPLSRPTTWSQIVLALGALAAAGVGAGALTKNVLIPKFKEWIRGVVLHGDGPVDQKKSNPVEDAINAAAKAAAAAAMATTEVAGVMKEIAHFRSEDREQFESIFKAVEAQTQELKNVLAGMKDAVQNVELTKVQGLSNGTQSFENQILSSKGLYATAPNPSARTSNGNEQVRSTLAFGTGGPSEAPHSQSYMDVIAMLQRGEKPPGIREVNDKPPNSNQPPSNAQLQPKAKPWERTFSNAPSPVHADGYQSSSRPRENWDSSGQSNSRLTSSAAEPSGSTEAWWRKSSAKIPMINEAQKTNLHQGEGSSSPSLSSSGPVRGQTRWVPPAVPQASYPGVEEAIRRTISSPIVQLTPDTPPVPAYSGPSQPDTEPGHVASELTAADGPVQSLPWKGQNAELDEQNSVTDENEFFQASSSSHNVVIQELDL